jgi:hypothetical protein
MTTVDRLFFKGLLNREKIEGRFVYWARLGPEDLEEMLDKDVLEYFRSRPERSREQILLSLIQSIKHDDPGLYEKLEQILARPPGVDPEQGSGNTARIPKRSTDALVKISSTPSGADVEIDEAFAGNTPSFLSLAQGEHAIRVAKQGYKEWTRKLKAYTGTITLHADLEQKSVGRKSV